MASRTSTAESASSERLRRYREKRSAARTPEPFGGATVFRPGLFVVQKHSARRLHHDLRLEHGGTLRSWAVPHGPSPNPADKRLAVETEDHPLEYADFEGIIPPGNYGAGAMIVWDRGLWVPLEDPEQGLAQGKLLFELYGYKLRGRWTLVRLKKEPKSWLLIKERDGWALRDPSGFAEQSILSGLTVEELAAGIDKAAPLRAELERLGAPRRAVALERVELMLAKTAPRPFSKPDWLFELKYDGYRLLAAAHTGQARLRYRGGGDASAIFPEVRRAVAALPFDSLLLDGEVVVLGADRRPLFQQLQQRAQLRRTIDAERGAIEHPATLFVFDLLSFEGFDLRPLPLRERKRLLQRLLPPVGPLRYVDHVEARGAELFHEVETMKLEGLIAKRAGSRYSGGRSAEWLKLRADRCDEFAVVGWSDPKDGRGGFGALHLAQFDGQQLIYSGRVGSGFDAGQLGAIRERLEPARRPGPPCAGPTPKGKEHHWVEPELVVEVSYSQWTSEGLLRQPVFKRIREDKRVTDCRRARAAPAAEPIEPAPRSAPPAAAGAGRKLELVRLEKIFWPEEGFTKGDLIAYYRAIAPWLLPLLRDRPVVLVRYPDGIVGKSFFQKKPPEFVPQWVRTESLWSEDDQEEATYFLVEDLDSLLYLINLGTIPLHIWSSRLESIGRPDWCILDLDPKEAPFANVIVLARAIHALCAEIELPCFIKTSGSTGLHVLLPLGAQCTHEQSRQLGELLARLVAAEHADIATTARTLAARRGRVYIDALQNGQGKLLVAPYSVRPLRGAPVSMPLRWSEVKRGLSIDAFTIRTAPKKLRQMKSDPLGPLLELKPDLPAVLGRLARRYES
ncbi:MAG TPA: DNA ligase D [Acidobacteriota bacterium]